MLRGLDLQKRLAAAVSLHPRRLSRQNRADLGKTASTLSATGELRPAVQLMIVDPDLWADCPEPEANRLHPELVPFKSISGHCRNPRYCEVRIEVWRKRRPHILVT